MQNPATARRPPPRLARAHRTRCRVPSTSATGCRAHLQKRRPSRRPPTRANNQPRLKRPQARRLPAQGQNRLLFQ